MSRRRWCCRLPSRVNVCLTVMLVVTGYHLISHFTTSNTDLQMRAESAVADMPVVDKMPHEIKKDLHPNADAAVTALPPVRKMAHEAKKKLSASQPGECNSYFDAVQMTRNVTVNILKQNMFVTNRSTVTLVTQLDSERLQRLVSLARLWKSTY
ncbi:hypothetical protein LSAT2_013633 [Lamellibrachia satsuma]|nr:hypothetical protein LSAT2_013633 [Lamellibrachia satsuma]